MPLGRLAEIGGLRSRADAARTLTLPFFTAVVRGGTAVVAKRLGQVTLEFPAGQYRAQASGEGFAVVNRAAATLTRLTTRRRTTMLIGSMMNR